MDLLEKALEIALKAYAGKKDKAGKTYILHPLRLMAKMATSAEMAVALLHDVIEDSEITATDLLQAGIPAEVVEAVQLLTRNPADTYAEFVRKTLSNKLAAKVKKADIEDNINLLRLPAVSQKDLERAAKYHAAWQLLTSAGKE